MIKSNYKSKTPKREKLILEFIRRKMENNPGKETFLVEIRELAHFDPLLGEADLLETAFGNISNGTGGNVKIDFRVTKLGTTATGDDMTESKIYIFVEDTYRLDDYYSELGKKLKKEANTYKFVLDTGGYFYPERAANKKHKFKKASFRYRLLSFLAKEKKYIATKSLASEFAQDEINVRKTVEAIRSIVEKMGLPRNAVIESDNESGYRVTNIILKHD